MNQEKYDRTLVALTDLIQSELTGTDRQRFARVGRLTKLAQMLQVEQNPRPEDAGMMRNAIAGADFLAGDDIGMMGMMANPQVGLGGDQNQIVREVLTMIRPIADGAAAQKRSHEASELRDLLRARDLAPDGEILEALTKRIKELTDRIGENNDDKSAMVLPLDVRRHPPGAGLGREDVDHILRALPDRERCDDGAPRAGREAAGDEVIVDRRGEGGPYYER